MSAVGAYLCYHLIVVVLVWIWVLWVILTSDGDDL